MDDDERERFLEATSTRRWPRIKKLVPAEQLAMMRSALREEIPADLCCIAPKVRGGACGRCPNNRAMSPWRVQERRTPPAVPRARCSRSERGRPDEPEEAGTAPHARATGARGLPGTVPRGGGRAHRRRQARRLSPGRAPVGGEARRRACGRHLCADGRRHVRRPREVPYPRRVPRPVATRGPPAELPPCGGDGVAPCLFAGHAPPGRGGRPAHGRRGEQQAEARLVREKPSSPPSPWPSGSSPRRRSPTPRQPPC